MTLGRSRRRLGVVIGIAGVLLSAGLVVGGLGVHWNAHRRGPAGPPGSTVPVPVVIEVVPTTSPGVEPGVSAPRASAQTTTTTIPPAPTSTTAPSRGPAPPTTTTSVPGRCPVVSVTVPGLCL